MSANMGFVRYLGMNWILGILILVGGGWLHWWTRKHTPKGGK